MEIIHILIRSNSGDRWHKELLYQFFCGGQDIAGDGQRLALEAALLVALRGALLEQVPP